MSTDRAAAARLLLRLVAALDAPGPPGRRLALRLEGAALALDPRLATAPPPEDPAKEDDPTA